jgi:predicted Zn-dependent protease
VLLDELVQLSANSDEIAAVLCHEIGHIQGHHSVRAALQNSASMVVLGLVLGDVASVTTFASAIPTVLLTSSYSRDFEREADRYGLALMNQAGIPLESFSGILKRLEAHEGNARYLYFLAAHPGTAERLEAIRRESR